MHQITVTFEDRHCYATFTNWDKAYGFLLSHLIYGDELVGRNGLTFMALTNTIIDLRLGFPLTGLRRLPVKNIIHEFLFDVGLSTNVSALGPARHFWDFLADEDGWLGASAYNRQWRSFPPSSFGCEVPNETLESLVPTDQLDNAVRLLRNQPYSRQATVITHNPTAIKPACPPCHLAMHFSPSGNGYLDLLVPSRSNDAIVGYPLDVARYALMLSVVSMMTNKIPRYLTIPGVNTHIYEPHIEAAREMISRKVTPTPKLKIDSRVKTTKFEDLTVDDFSIVDYKPQAGIKLAVVK